MFNTLNDQLDRIVQKLRQQPVFQWAVVTSVSPLQIRYDGATDPVAGSPDRTVTGLQVGDRVWCQRIHRRDIILGVAKGGDTGWIQLNGWTGSFAQATNPVHYRRIGNEVIFKGALSNNAWEGSFTHFGVTMPVGFRPLGTERYFNLPANSTATTKRLCQIRPNGQVLLYGEGKSAAWWNFDEVRYRTD